MIAVLLDQGLAPRAAAILRDRTFDAIHVMEIGMAESDDADILQMARNDNRVCVTLDHDFHTRLALAGEGHPSVILLRIEGLSAEAQADLIESICRQCQIALSDGVAISRDFSGYRGKLVAVRGVYFNGLRQNCPQTCTTGPWPSFVDLIGLDHNAPGQPPVGFILDDAGWAALDTAEPPAEREAKQGKRVEVWVTVLGRIKANPRRSPAGPCDIVVNGGYGHLGAFPAQLVTQGFSDIQVIPNANSPYGYSKVYHGAP